MLSKTSALRFLIALLIMCVFGTTAIASIVIQSKTHIFDYNLESSSAKEYPNPFPVGVDPEKKQIIEDPLVSTFFTESIASAPKSSERWWNKVAAIFVQRQWYQNLASPVGRIVVIWPGERKEEVAKHIGDILNWSQEDRALFQTLISSSSPSLPEGKYYPGQYVTHKQATPEEVASLISTEFETEILSRYTPEVSSKVSLEDALIIASLLEREASDFTNMREVSGVIWNRLFIDMPLQLDATLQYVRGSKSYESKWWPKVVPADKFLDSEFNTYKHAGLPPAPIANPSAEAVLAALNPIVTDCLYYFHTNSGGYYCSADYEGHVSKLRELYGRGS